MEWLLILKLVIAILEILILGAACIIIIILLRKR